MSRNNPDDLYPALIGRLRAAAELPLGSSPRELAAQLRAGIHPPDSAFDQHLIPDVIRHSSRHWTPLHVTSRAVRWLEQAGARSVVDIGSGAGKFCVTAALCARLRCTGLEQRPHLVHAARHLARLFTVDDRVHFIEGVFGQTELPAADAYYMFNPFAENILERDARLDGDVPLSLDRFTREVRAVKAFLSELPAGTLVLTYYGFGGRMPDGFDEVRADSRIPALLRLFRKNRRA